MQADSRSNIAISHFGAFVIACIARPMKHTVTWRAALVMIITFPLNYESTRLRKHAAPLGVGLFYSSQELAKGFIASFKARIKCVGGIFLFGIKNKK